MYVSSHTLLAAYAVVRHGFPRLSFPMFYLCVISTLTGFYILYPIIYLSQTNSSLDEDYVYHLCYFHHFKEQFGYQNFIVQQPVAFKGIQKCGIGQHYYLLKHIVLNKNYCSLLQILPAKLHQLFFWHKASLEQVGLMLLVLMEKQGGKNPPYLE